MSYFGIPIRNGVPIGLGALAPLASQAAAAPSLSLNFTSGVLDSRVTFTRASTATYFNSAGALTSAAINQARFDYNPTTLAPLGLLIEEQRTNLVLNSDTLITQSVTVTGVAHTLSFYGTGTVVISGTGTGTLVGSGAFPTRSTLTFTPTVGVVILTVTGTVTQAQLEAGAFPSSYIPTTAAAATRAPDITLMSTVTPWYNATAGTMYAEFSIPYTSATSPRLFSLLGAGGAVVDEILLFVSQTLGKAASFNVFTAGVNSGRIDATPTFVVNTIIKAVGSYATNDRAVTANGAAATTSSTVYTIPTITSARLGMQDAGVNIPLNGYLRTIAYYPRRLSNAQLQALTV